MSEENMAAHMDLPLPATLEEAVQQRDAWVNDAVRFHRNECFWREIVLEVGRMLGPNAFTSDDGSVWDEPLALKVVPTLRALLAKGDGG